LQPAGFELLTLRTSSGSLTIEMTCQVVACKVKKILFQNKSPTRDVTDDVTDDDVIDDE